MTRSQLASGLAPACSPKRAIEAMSTWLPERRIHCPFCGEQISIVVDPSSGSQSYVEDCEVCCQPMQITIAVEDDELQTVQVSC